MEENTDLYTVTAIVDGALDHEETFATFDDAWFEYTNMKRDYAGTPDSTVSLYDTFENRNLYEFHSR